MLDPSTELRTPSKQKVPPAALARATKKKGRLNFAKWPPDDDGNLPAGPTIPAGGGGGGMMADDGNFKRGRFNPAVIVLGIVIVLGGVAAVYFGVQSQGEKLTVQQIAEEKKNIFILPKKDQAPRWQKWAGNPNAEALQQEAIMQLAWAEDPAGIDFATKALAQGNHRVNGVAAQALAYYGSPKADGAKPALLAALKNADDSDRPQLVWALVELKEPQVFQAAMAQYRQGFLSKVERLGGGPAFDTEKLAKLVSLDELAKLASDSSASVRQLVATVLSREAEPKWTPTLIKLVQDKDIEVAREAANGLGKIGDEAARAPLLAALENADKDNRQKFLEALRDGIGGEGLVLALDSVKSEPAEATWFQTKQIFEMLREIADPRIGDRLIKWVETKKPLPHWAGEAGTRMAEVGDIRGAKFIGERMNLDPTKLYEQQRFWEADEGGHLSRTDLPRVVGARMLADLATMYPDRAADLRVAEQPVLDWITGKPQPHANGLRFLAGIKSEKTLPKMRDWAFPKEEMPKEGSQPPFPAAFETSQSALRYIGLMRDEASFGKLIDQLKRKKDPRMDITQEGLQGAGLAMLGMALRAVAYGASQGLAHFGDGRAVEPMMKFIEDETWHEEARQAACEALPWCADEKQMGDVAKKAVEFAGKPEPRKQLIGACYASALALKPVPTVVPQLVDLLTPQTALGVRIAVANAIGKSGFDEASQAKLFEKLKDPEIRNAAALALILGGTPETGARTVAMYADFGRDALDDLKDHYYRSFGYWSDEDFKRGNIYRWVANAESITRVKIGDAPQEWARQRLQAQFDNLRFDNGPHSETRVVLRHRLYEDAKKGDAARKKGATMTLKFMREKGVLMALRQEQGETGELARRAFFELMNPKGVIAEDLSKLQPPGKEKNP